MSAFTAYFDASGAESDQPCLAVAGYVALAEQWMDFETAWKSRLKDDGLDLFHAVSVRSKLSNDPSRINRLYRDLIKIIRGNVLQKFGCCVINKSLAKWSKRDKDKWNLSAYSMAGRTCASQLKTWTIRQNMPTLPEMIFESGDTGKGTLMKLLKEDGFPDPIFKPKKDTVTKGLLVKAAIPLQAADLLAYECFGPMREMEQLGQLTEIRWQYEDLDKTPGSPKVIMVENMDQLQKIMTMKKGGIWLPDGPEDIIVKKLSSKRV